MPRLDSSKGRSRCKLELSAMAARARRVRANPLETKARAKAKAKVRTRISTRAMTETRARNATIGTKANGKRNSRDTAHIDRSAATNVQIGQERLSDTTCGNTGCISSCELVVDASLEGAAQKVTQIRWQGRAEPRLGSGLALRPKDHHFDA